MTGRKISFLILFVRHTYITYCTKALERDFLDFFSDFLDIWKKKKKKDSEIDR